MQNKSSYVLKKIILRRKKYMMNVDPKLASGKREPIQVLREHCKNVVHEKKKREEENRKKEQAEREKKQKEVQSIVENWLNKKFGYGKKPWRAIEGQKKKIKPIPFYEYECDIKWTDIPIDLMIETIETLGFIVYPSLNAKGITLAIQKWERGEKPTWAQERIKKLNYDYSLYAEDEKKLAQFLFKQMLLELADYDIDKTEVCDGYTLFRNYTYGETRGIKSKLNISPKCYKFIKRLYIENKIEEYFVNGKYIGLRVFFTE